MDEKILQPSESFTYETDGSKWLEVRYSSGEIEVSSPTLNPVRLSSGEVYDVSGSSKLTIINVSGEENTISLQTFDRLKVGNLATDVAVTNKVVIDRIEQALTVNAQFDSNNAIHVVSGGTYKAHADKTVNAKQSRELLPANANRKFATIQLISGAVTPVRIGDATVAANVGSYVSGSLAKPATIEIKTTDAIHAFNDADSEANFTITEVLK